jgi:hypothetical protein
VPSARGVQKKKGQGGEGAQAPTPRHVAMTWAQRLKRVFGIEIDRCEHCGGAVKIIACVQDKLAIRKILVHLNETSAPAPLPPARGPPGRLSGSVQLTTPTHYLVSLLRRLSFLKPPPNASRASAAQSA